ncbi:MAG: FAD-dependent oxidoreductase [Gammaproteobacteria bacterium]
MAKIAVIGGGISGLTASYLLSQDHHVTLFEQQASLGGHTHTVTTEISGRQYAIDVGFIVFNQQTYPHFWSLMQQFGVAIQKTEMSFSYSAPDRDFEYKGKNIASLFAQRSNLLNKQFYRLLADISRFNKLTKQSFHTSTTQPYQTVAEFIKNEAFSQLFIDCYLIPMAAAIWSNSPQRILDYPWNFFINFYYNHGLLNNFNRPQWYTIKNGSHNYIPHFVRKVHTTHTDTPVKHIKRKQNFVELNYQQHQQLHTEVFDYVFIATHSDQALHLLTDATLIEQQALTALPYQRNTITLHTDTSLLPKRKRTWASWNYHGNCDHLALTYYMNILQRIQSDTHFCVTVNHKAEIDPHKIIKTFYFDHPCYSQAAMQAQQQLAKFNGTLRTYYCGAYHGWGFHEDGVLSAIKSVESFKAQYMAES